MTAPRSQRFIALFWLPLAATWIMMAFEGPFLAAVIARLPDPTFNLAAHGVAFALAVLTEAPVMMLMSAATALVHDRVSFLRLRRFSWAVNVFATLLVVVVLLPAVYAWLTGTVMGLPSEVADITYGALWFFLPWPSAIGYRRFLQGVLIRTGKTKLVAYGTIIRLVTMSAAATAGYLWLDLPGASIGALALASGVCVEAVTARLMAGSTIRDLLAAAPAVHSPDATTTRAAAPRPGHDVPRAVETAASEDPHLALGEEAALAEEGLAAEETARMERPRTATLDGPRGARSRRGTAGGAAGGAARDAASTPSRPLSYRGIAAFYYPLALTSFIGLTVHPMLTFFMGRSVSPVESLAVFPVVHSLGFLFRSMGLAFQDVSIALIGDEFEHLPELQRFALMLGTATSAALALVAFTPLSDVWFVTVSGLSPELTEFALLPTRIIVPLPALSVLLSLQRAVLVQVRRTRLITIASAIEVATVAAVFVGLGWGLGLVGATAAFTAFLAGRSASNTYLFWGCRVVLRRFRELRATAPAT